MTASAPALETGWDEKPRPARLISRSVFQINGTRLAIGAFDRPLRDAECRLLKKAWERSALPGVVDFEVNAKQVSFLTQPRRVETTWRAIDSLLANPSKSTTS